ncbi:hypothetical protein [Streptomyces sp. NPDC012616]|uniref:hypothetical protein n=1 Tax=Streptomyces sp. NPDC012616 TaxID=3364840 RepID=UPI0036EAC005
MAGVGLDEAAELLVSQIDPEVRVLRWLRARLRSPWAGKYVIVTGAGSGIGRAGALLFAAQGTRVVLAHVHPAGDTDDLDIESHGPGVLSTCMGNVGRAVTADEQDTAIVFLASAAASNIDGVMLLVDNGWSAV